MPLTEAELLTPYRKVAKIGRFNNFSVCHLYLSDNMETSKLEIGKSQAFNTIVIQNHSDFNLLDISLDGNIIYNFCLKQKKRPSILSKRIPDVKFHFSVLCDYFARIAPVRTQVQIQRVPLHNTSGAKSN